MKLLTGWLKPKEHAWLSVHAKNAKRVLEVGSYHGRSTTALLNAERVWCVDLWGSSGGGYTINEKDYKTFTKNMKPYRDKIEVLRGDSHEMLDALIKSSEGFFDMAFVDGCHQYKFVYGDILRCKRLVREGGLLCGHDYNTRAWPGVVKAVNELIPHFKRVRGTSLWWTLV
jgi:predicted O-methyltransferase YrrM